MSRIAYVNGSYVPHAQASVHIEDRGYQFSDGVYEVWAIQNSKLRDHQQHLTRLQRSLSELDIPFTHTNRSLNMILGEVIRRNRVRNGMVYLQITRGVAPRDHSWAKDIIPSIVVTAKSVDPAQAANRAKTGVSVITLADLRWKRRDIKSVSLLPNVLAKQSARDHGAFEAWLVDEKGFVTEGTSSNAWIVTQDNVLITRSVNSDILSGVTRLSLLELAKELQLKTEQRKFTIDEAKQAKEAFVSSATTLAMPVVKIDQSVIGTGKPGMVAQRLREAYIAQGHV